MEAREEQRIGSLKSGEIREGRKECMNGRELEEEEMETGEE